MTFAIERALANIGFVLGAELECVIEIEDLDSVEQLEYLVVSACFHIGISLDNVTREGRNEVRVAITDSEPRGRFCRFVHVGNA